MFREDEQNKQTTARRNRGKELSRDSGPSEDILSPVTTGRSVFLTDVLEHICFNGAGV